MKINRKEAKQKVSVDLTLSNYEALEAYKETYVKEAYGRKSTTQTINDCLYLLLDNSNEFKRELAMICKEKLAGILPDTFHKQKKISDIRKWEDLYYFLTNGRGIPDEKKTFTRIDFSNGYIIVPSNWIFINPNSANNEYYVYPHIIEFRNGSKYNLPHFFFLSESENINEYDEKEILTEACKCYPLLKEIMPLITHAIIEEGKILNWEVYKDSPEPGFFSFPKPHSTDKSLMGEWWVTKELIDSLSE